MKPMDVYWHIYSRDQIKLELRGRLIYLLEIPSAPGSPVMRHVFDPDGREFPANSRQRVMALLSNLQHGIVFDGVSKHSVYDVLLYDPKIRREDPLFLAYNRGIISNSRTFFLNDPERGLKALPPATVRLLNGETAGREGLSLKI